MLTMSGMALLFVCSFKINTRPPGRQPIEKY
jgi:hypothetical protein